MSRILLPLLLAICTLTWAQTPSGSEQTAAAEAGEPIRPCPPAGDSTPAADGNGSSTGDEPASVPCAEPQPESSGEIVAGPEAAIEEDPAIEASATDVFKPGEEIPEDYPVPLPSDI